MVAAGVNFRQCREGEGAGSPPAFIWVKGHEGKKTIDKWVYSLNGIGRGSCFGGVGEGSPFSFSLFTVTGGGWEEHTWRCTHIHTTNAFSDMHLYAHTHADSTVMVSVQCADRRSYFVTSANSVCSLFDFFSVASSNTKAEYLNFEHEG